MTTLFTSIYTGSEYHCSTIDYFPKDEYSPDPNDSTMAIPCKYQYINCPIKMFVIHFLWCKPNTVCMKYEIE